MMMLLKIQEYKYKHRYTYKSPQQPPPMMMMMKMLLFQKKQHYLCFLQYTMLTSVSSVNCVHCIVHCAMIIDQCTGQCTAVTVEWVFNASCTAVCSVQCAVCTALRWRWVWFSGGDWTTSRGQGTFGLVISHKAEVEKTFGGVVIRPGSRGGYIFGGWVDIKSVTTYEIFH